jgi:hypothetical protein
MDVIFTPFMGFEIHRLYGGRVFQLQNNKQKGLTSMKEIPKREYMLLRKSGALDKRRSDFGEAVICSRRKKGNGKTYIVSDRLADLAFTLAK